MSEARRRHRLVARISGAVAVESPGEQRAVRRSRAGLPPASALLPFLAVRRRTSCSAFFMAASKFLRAFVQALSLSGTAQSPIPLHLFSPGFSPQPPFPAQSFCPLHAWSLTVGPWAWPAQSFAFPLPRPCRSGSARDRCGVPGGEAASWGFSSWASPPRAAGAQTSHQAAQGGRSPGGELASVHVGYVHQFLLEKEWGDTPHGHPPRRGGGVARAHLGRRPAFPAPPRGGPFRRPLCCWMPALTGGYKEFARRKKRT